MNVPCQINDDAVGNVEVLYTSRAVVHGKTTMFPNAVVVPEDAEGILCRTSDKRVVGAGYGLPGEYLYVDDNGIPSWIDAGSSGGIALVPDGGCGRNITLNASGSVTGWLNLCPSYDERGVVINSSPSASSVISLACTNLPTSPFVQQTSSAVVFPTDPAYPTLPVLENFFSGAGGFLKPANLVDLMTSTLPDATGCLLLFTCPASSLFGNNISLTVEAISDPGQADDNFAVVKGTCTFRSDTAEAAMARSYGVNGVSGGQVSLTAFFVDNTDTISLFPCFLSSCPVEISGYGPVSTTVLFTATTVFDYTTYGNSLLNVQWADRLQFCMWVDQPPP